MATEKKSKAPAKKSAGTLNVYLEKDKSEARKMAEMDTRGTAKAGRADKEMAAVETVNGRKYGGR